MQLSLTPRAAAPVAARARDADVAGWLLRVAVVAGGCHGLPYGLYFVPQASPPGMVVGGEVALAATYMALVGAYHTVLALFGWDGGPGILRKNPHYVPGSDEPLPDDTPLDPKR